MSIEPDEKMIDVFTESIMTATQPNTEDAEQIIQTILRSFANKCYEQAMRECYGTAVDCRLSIRKLKYQEVAERD